MMEEGAQMRYAVADKYGKKIFESDSKLDCCLKRDEMNRHRRGHLVVLGTPSEDDARRTKAHQQFMSQFTKDDFVNLNR